MSFIFRNDNETILIIPEIRKLNEFEKEFVKGNFDKVALKKLEQIDFQGGKAYISITSEANNAQGRRKQLLENLAQRMQPDGSLEFSKLDEATKDSIFNGIWGAKRKDKSAVIPVKLEAIYRYQFDISGDKVDIVSAKPWKAQPFSQSIIPKLEDLIEPPSETVSSNGKELVIGEQTSEGIQMLFQISKRRDSLHKLQIQVEAQRAYLQFKAIEYEKNGKLLDQLFSKLVDADATTTMDSAVVPERIIRDLSAELMRKFPLKFPDLNSARVFALQGKCLSGDREIDLCTVVSIGGTSATVRYRLMYRPYKP